MSRTLKRITTVMAAAAIAVLPATALVPPAGAATSLGPVADSYVDSGSPTRNYGARSYVKSDGSPTLVSYVKFTVAGSSPIGYAALRLRALSQQRTGVTVHSVAENGWSESGLSYQNRPPVGAALGETGPTTAGVWYTVDVSSLVTGAGTYSFALTTTNNTSVKFASRESGADAPQLILDTSPPPTSTSFDLQRIGDVYQAVSPQTGSTYTGSLKFAGEHAVAELEDSGGGTLNFAPGVYDFGSEYFKFQGVHNVTFAGAGMDETIIRNYTSAAADTEPFNFSGAFDITVRDLTVSAGGPGRSTSDALDFDNGNNCLVENVKVVDSRAKGIVFDGKNDSWNSANNVVRGVVITGVDSIGIHLLAATDNLIENSHISNTGTYGIQAGKASTGADQANKKASRNIIRNNVIDQAGQDGINVNSGDDNQVIANTVTNSSDDVSGRDGIRISTSDGITSQRNVVSGNTATDTQATKTQRYGLNLVSSSVIGTVVRDNDFTGNLLGPIRDLGTSTVYE
ncbi:DUF7594 domain-containing protein [Nocardioides piscis]|uniref:Right-handed parallel beta-helix repeat-containing protein n=1 Tax=Nocardioides piscis TaxID=2714938 RepID=A0A6G7YBV7_9ACTN|nr:DNRLRE domain-containing protein [Nocardioides piscis]QIK74285.1 right-handed parallel beta-helix repeat-containing protein [Nocardioides piscis]